MNEFNKKMTLLGLSASGAEQMIDPNSGRCYEDLMFMGPIYYQRLKHLVQDKIFYRNRGMVNAVTRQPLKGRTKEGGLRFGEMERDCILSHGLTEVLKERLFKVSDYFKVMVCGTCGVMLNCKKKETYCKICGKVTFLLCSGPDLMKFRCPMQLS